MVLLRSEEDTVAHPLADSTNRLIPQKPLVLAIEPQSHHAQPNAGFHADAGARYAVAPAGVADTALPRVGDGGRAVEVSACALSQGRIGEISGLCSTDRGRALVADWCDMGCTNTADIPLTTSNGAV